MSFTQERITFPSADGKNTISGRIFVPVGSAVNGVIQISHGMIDHIGRYYFLIDALTARGYAVAGNDHLGHGESVSSDSDFGFFAEKGGVDFLLRDLHSMNRHLRARFPGKKPVLFGHSMGSFLSRLYVLRYPHTVSGHIIHGTGGPMGAILPMGKALVSTVSFFKGKRYRSGFISSVAFAGYNSHYPKSEGKNAWLTRDLATVSTRDEDKFTSFTFTVSAFKDLFRMVGESNSKKWFATYPKNIPTLVMAGDDDPVGKYGKGPTYVYKNLLMSGVGSISFKLYEGARHELFNETSRDEVFKDIESWLGEILR
jgi:alpha-beta hydrolase superfamily lysophospholipase